MIMKCLVAYCIIAEDIEMSSPGLCCGDEGAKKERNGIIALQIPSEAGMELLGTCSERDKLTMHSGQAHKD
jgi:hypothetical protein